MISTAVLRRHLETMDRLGIEYDFLPRESEILRLHFWAAAFEQLKQKKVLYFETEGKNKGCWVMTRPSSRPVAARGRSEDGMSHEELVDEALTEIGRELTAEGPDEDAKVIVRSNGTVGYVGKDIAYHLWKFGLLGRDFGYRKFYRYPNGNEVWISAETGRDRASALRRRGRHLQRDRLPPERAAEDGEGGHAAAGYIDESRRTTPTSPTRWWRSRRAARWNWATTSAPKSSRRPTSKSAGARASA